jgi:hypothetical protein
MCTRIQTHTHKQTHAFSRTGGAICGGGARPRRRCGTVRGTGDGARVPATGPTLRQRQSRRLFCARRCLPLSTWSRVSGFGLRVLAFMAL